MEGWQSGWLQRSWKPPRGKTLRGFESLPLRTEYWLSADPEALILGLRIEVSSNPLAFTAEGFELYVIV